MKSERASDVMSSRRPRSEGFYVLLLFGGQRALERMTGAAWQWM